jgi:hypothetical protein
MVWTCKETGNRLPLKILEWEPEGREGEDPKRDREME